MSVIFFLPHPQASNTLPPKHIGAFSPTHHQHSTRWFQICFYVHPENWGRFSPILTGTHIFQMGWFRKTTHQAGQHLAHETCQHLTVGFGGIKCRCTKVSFNVQRSDDPSVRLGTGIGSNWWTDEWVYNLLINGGFLLGWNHPLYQLLILTSWNPRMLKMCFCLAVGLEGSCFCCH